MYPKVTVNVTNGNLQRSIAVEDAVCGICATAGSSATNGKLLEVYSLADAESKGVTAEAEPLIHKLVRQFYQELGGKQLLYIYGSDDSPMDVIVGANTSTGLNKMLTLAGGKLNLVAVSGDDWNGDGFLADEVADAVIASKAVCQAWQNRNYPVRLFLNGHVMDESVANTYQPKEGTNGYAAVVLGGEDTTGDAAVGIALGRASKYGAEVKLGNGQNGALSLTQVYIGHQKMEERKSMAQLKDDVSKGLITFDMVQDAFRSATSEGGRFNNMLGKIAETPAGKMEQLKGAWEEMKIKAGEAFMPLLSAAMELAERVMPMIETGIGKLAELVSPFVDKIKDGKEQFGGLMDYVNIVKDIVVNTIVPYFEKLWGIVSDIVVDIVEFVSQSEILKDAFKLIGEFAASVYDWISNILDAFSWLWNNVVMPLLEGLDKAYSAIKDLFGYGDKKGTSSGRKQVTAPKAVTTSDNETKTILNDIKTNTNQNTAATKDAVSAVKGGGQKVINIQIGKFFDNIQFQTTNLTESVEDIEQTVLECMGRVLLNGAVAGTQ